MSLFNRCIGLSRGVCARFSGGLTHVRGMSQSLATTSILVPRSASQISYVNVRNLASQTETQLCDFLKQEIEDEKRLVREQLGDAPTPTIAGFKIETSDAQVVLSKSHGAEKVTVVFNVNNSVDATADFEQESAPEESAAVSKLPMVSRPPFTVEVEKGGEKLSFECRMIDPAGEGPEEGDIFAIEEMYVYSGKEVTEKTFVTSGAILDGTLYDRLMDYLDERGVNSDFVEAMQKFATHYEHAQYTLILQKVHDFVKSP